MAYENQCGTCDYFKDARNTNVLFDKNNPSNIKGYCEWYKAFYYPDDSCGHHRSRDYVPGGCFITTVVCDKLGYSDQCEVLESLREFRKDVLQKDVSYAPILYQYDVMGPEISKHIGNDSIELSQKIYDCFLVPIVNLLKEKEYEVAVKRYISMTNLLKNYYGVTSPLEVDSSYIFQNGGHGYLKKHL